MRVVFMGSPDFAVPTLYALIAAGHEVAAAYCQPPRPAGRGKSLQPTSVQRTAELLGIPVHTPASLKRADQQDEFAALRADIAVVAAYGLILPQPILDAPRLGCLNVHASLLPRWRGAAPVQRAILAGDPVTGVTIMQMEAGLDTGPMLAAQEVATNRKTAGQLTGELGLIGAHLMAQVLSSFASYPHVAQPDEGVTYAAKVRKDEARLDFKQSAEVLERQVRAFNPAPGAFTTHQGERIRILEAEIEDGIGPAGTVTDDRLTIACGEGSLRPVKVQRAGRAAMPAEELLRGFPIPEGHNPIVTRWKLILEWDGTPFMGWQRQDHGPSVQAAVERAALAMTGEAVTAHAAGRTDAGVHALAMAAHVDIAKTLTPHRLREGLNALLRPDPVAVLAVEPVADDWHARFSCTGRRYLYRIANRRAPLALDAKRAWRIGPPLNFADMREGAAYLVGHHDFTTFRSVHCQSDSPVKTLDALTVQREEDEIHVRAEARSFLHHQVRSMVGCLALVGLGRWQPEDVREALEARDRAALGLNAPPEGLYFAEALYP